MLVLAMSGIMSHRVVHGAGQGAIPDRPPDELRRLLTPRQICAFRAHQASLIELPTGIVVDPAAGSGGQLAAYAEMLQKSCLGIEMSPERAAFCADSMSALSSKTPSLVLCGDGLAAEGAQIQSGVTTPRLSPPPLWVAVRWFRIPERVRVHLGTTGLQWCH